MIINHNMNAMNAHRLMSGNTASAGKSMEKLSSGLRINRAGDDAAGLAISEKMRGQIRGLDQAGRNSQDGISLIQTAEGALNETHSILQRIRELAVQASNDTTTDNDRTAMQKEVSALKTEVDRIASTTEFNTKKLLNGDITESLQAQGTKIQSNTLMAFARMTGPSLASATTANTCGKNVTINGVQVTIGTVATASVASVAANIARSINNTAGISVTASVTAGNTVVLKSKTAGQNITIAGTAADLGNMGLKNAAATTQSSAVNANTLLIDLADSNGNTFGLVGGTDSVSTSGMLGGTVPKTGAYAVTNTSKVSDLYGDVVTDLGMNQASVTSEGKIEFIGNDGLTSALSAVKFTVTGKVNFNNAFSSFAETQAAQNTTSDQSLSFQIGSNMGQTMAVGIKEMSVRTLSLTGVDVSTRGGANTAISTLDTAINTVSLERSKLGAYQNRLEHTIANLGTSSENLTAAESRIRDVDMAKEMMSFSKNNILSQAAQAMLAQANQQPQGVLQLLR